MAIAIDTRERLVEAATEVFSEQGYDGTRVQDIARRAGLTTGAIYSQFRGKADLLLEAIARSGEDELARLLASGPLPHADEVLTRLGQSLVGSGATTEDALLLEALVAARRDPQVGEMMRDSLGASFRNLGLLLALGKEEGVIDASVSIEAAATFCMAVALGLMIFRCLEVPTPQGKPWAQLISRLVAALGAPSGKESE